MSENLPEDKPKSPDQVFYEQMLRKNPNINLDDLAHFVDYGRDSSQYTRERASMNTVDPLVQNEIYQKILLAYVGQLKPELATQFQDITEDTVDTVSEKNRLLGEIERVVNDAHDGGFAISNIYGLQEKANNFANIPDQTLRGVALESFLHHISK